MVAALARFAPAEAHDAPTNAAAAPTPVPERSPAAPEVSQPAAGSPPAGLPPQAPKKVLPEGKNDTGAGTSNDPNRVLRLYTDGYGASYLPVPGFAPVDMPVRDATDGAPGCYIACSTHERHNSIYAPDANTFVVGAVRILGNYQNGACHPGGQERVDLAADSRLSELCALAMPKVCDRHRCFANGDTGTWVSPSQNTLPQSNPGEPKNGQESCVLACYSHNGDGALYQVSSDVFAVGGFQTAGKWVESACKPRDTGGDLGADPNFKRRCTELFPKQCPNASCWPSGDTRGRLGGT